MAKTNFHALIDNELIILLDFYADWYRPYKALMSFIQDMKEKLGDQVHIIKIDIDENEEVSKQLNIRSIPTLIIYNKEEMQWRQTGSESKQTLVRKLEKYLD